MGIRSPESLGGPGGSLLLHVKDVDAMFAQTVAAGAKTMRSVQDQFYGDPFGHVWTIATHKEDVPPEEITKRLEASKQGP